MNESRTTTYNESAIFESSMQNRSINIIQGSVFTPHTWERKRAKHRFALAHYDTIRKLTLRISFIIFNNYAKRNLKKIWFYGLFYIYYLSWNN